MGNRYGYYGYGYGYDPYAYGGYGYGGPAPYGPGPYGPGPVGHPPRPPAYPVPQAHSYEGYGYGGSYPPQPYGYGYGARPGYGYRSQRYVPGPAGTTYDLRRNRIIAPDKVTATALDGQDGYYDGRYHGIKVKTRKNFWGGPVGMYPPPGYVHQYGPGIGYGYGAGYGAKVNRSWDYDDWDYDYDYGYGYGSGYASTYVRPTAYSTPFVASSYSRGSVLRAPTYSAPTYTLGGGLSYPTIWEGSDLYGGYSSGLGSATYTRSLPVTSEVVVRSSPTYTAGMMPVDSCAARAPVTTTRTYTRQLATSPWL